MNISVWTEDAIRCTIGEPVEVTNLKFFGQKKSEEADNFWKLVSGYYRTIFHNSVEEYEGVGDMLDSLHERGYKTAVCSNADEEYIEEVLDKLNLREKNRSSKTYYSRKRKSGIISPFFTG